MNIDDFPEDELLDMDDIEDDGEPLTAEEFALLEMHVLDLARELCDTLQGLADSIAADHPEAAAMLMRPALRLLHNVEAAAALGGDPPIVH
jgi:hypothetical protein